MVVRPAMMDGLDTVTLTERQKAKLKMLRFSIGVTRMGKIRVGFRWRPMSRSGDPERERSINKSLKFIFHS